MPAVRAIIDARHSAAAWAKRSPRSARSSASAKVTADGMSARRNHGKASALRPARMSRRPYIVRSSSIDT